MSTDPILDLARDLHRRLRGRLLMNAGTAAAALIANDTKTYYQCEARIAAYKTAINDLLQLAGMTESELLGREDSP